MSAKPVPLPTQPQQLQRTRLDNGVELHWAAGGHGEAVVFVHGVMGDWLAWAPQWPAFTAAFRCWTYSRRYNYPNANTQPSPDHSALIVDLDVGVLAQSGEVAPSNHAHLEGDSPGGGLFGTWKTTGSRGRNGDFSD